MGRNRGFNESAVVAAAAVAFSTGGYEATSIDDLVRCTGLHRGSLYQAFGSKRGLFLLALRRACTELAGESWTGPTLSGSLDLLLIALLELAPRDPAVADLLEETIRRAPAADVTGVLGRRLVARAGLTTDRPAGASTPADSGLPDKESP
ncbi:MAG: TetR/AcrR family transcriptional regulator [Humibacillus sp.]|nr:TetR/AcrR family transcriptional regulator [Humibacillus sp.]MDN5778788.1 TetR/AcrR family transcriptional regulator [Humibacillus sp.]